MDLIEKIRSLPTQPGVYMYKNAAGEVIYVGKAKSLRARVRSYFNEGVGEADAKTGSLLREALDVEYIVVANEKEALALENNLIKQKQPRFNILLRDDKTYPYIKLTRSLRQRMDRAAIDQEYERAARYRDLLSTVEQLQEKQRIAAVEGDDVDVFGYHFENQMLAVNVFHMRGGKILDRRDFFWEDLPERQPGQPFHPGEFFSALVKQIYIDQQYVPRNVLVPVDFEDRVTLEELLSEKRQGKVEILVPQRGEKRSLIDL